MIINAIIVEDEPFAQEKLKGFIQKAPFIQLLACLDGATDAITFLKNNKVDLMFLDIQMDGLTGIQLLELLPKRPDVIITTAYDSYALKGFDLSVTDYLLKPYTLERFLQAVHKVYDKLSASAEKEQPFMFVKTEYRLEKVRYEDILYIEGMGEYRRIHLVGKKLLTLQALSELEQQLAARNFCRVHKSYIISIDRMESIERDGVKIAGEMIPVSASYKEAFLQRVGLNNGR